MNRQQPGPVMHALRAHARGGPEVRVYEKAPTPTVAETDILVEVNAAAITFVELTRGRELDAEQSRPHPIIPSPEFSGNSVAEIGSAVTEFDIGKALGTTEVIDIRNDDFATRTGAFDVVIDTVSGDTLDRCYALLRRGGRLITLQSPPDQRRAAQLGITRHLLHRHRRHVRTHQPCRACRQQRVARNHRSDVSSQPGSRRICQRCPGWAPARKNRAHRPTARTFGQPIRLNSKEVSR